MLAAMQFIKISLGHYCMLLCKLLAYGYTGMMSVQMCVLTANLFCSWCSAAVYTGGYI